MKELKFIALCVIIFVCRTQFTYGCNHIEQKSFAVKVFNDYYKVQSKYTKAEVHWRVINTSDELLDSVLRFVDNMHKQNRSQYDTLYVIEHIIEGRVSYFSIICQDVVLRVYCKDIYFYELGCAPVLDLYDDVYVSILKNWSTDSLKDKYIWNHFEPLIVISSSCYATRLIYFREKLIVANKVLHLDFVETNNLHPCKEYPPKRQY